jgi:hypothetical protein
MTAAYIAAMLAVLTLATCFCVWLYANSRLRRANAWYARKRECGQNVFLGDGLSYVAMVRRQRNSIFAAQITAGGVLFLAAWALVLAFVPWVGSSS